MALESFTIQDGCAFLRPTGKMNWKGIAPLLLQAMAECQATEARNLLVDFRATTLAPADAAERFNAATALAERWDRSFMLAVVVAPEQLDKDRFGERVARNRGVQIRVWLSEEEALSWLRSGPRRR